MLTNATRYAVADVPDLDPRGVDVVTALVKATFEVDRSRRVVPADVPSEIRIDEVLTRPGEARSSVRYPSDLGTAKVGTDVVVVGDAFSAKPVTSVDIGIRIRDHFVPIRVHGERRFERDLFRKMVISDPAPFVSMPVVYERAYGGASADWSELEERNWAGVGVAKNSSELSGTPAPQIEHPARPHLSAADRFPPVGSGAIPSHWSPRKDYYGKVDASWKETRAPLPPKDYDPRYANVAHPDLQVFPALSAGDDVSVTSMAESGIFRFGVPALPLIIVGMYSDGSTQVVRPPIDLLLLEPGRARFELLARATFALGRGTRTLREVRVDTDA
jgi:hypothetical protein